jgi:hypothetical protein
MKTSKASKDFLKYVRKICKDNGVTLKFGKGRLVKMQPFNFKVAGYFDEEEKLLHCGRGLNESDFLSTLVHEFAHVLQWIDGDTTYKNCDHEKYGSVQNLVCQWIKDEVSIRDRELINYTKKMIACELNAERRAVKLIKKFDLPIDIKRYSEHASATLYTYWMTLKTKKWDFKIGAKQRAASGHSLRRSFNSLPKKVETSFLEA